MYLKTLLAALKCNSVGESINLDNILVANIISGLVPHRYNKHPTKLLYIDASKGLEPSSFFNFSHWTTGMLTNLLFSISNFLRISLAYFL